jgi:hypothetical protein
VLEIPNLGRMQARGEVEEAHSGMVREGQVVRFRLDAHPDHEYSGTVRSILRSVSRKSWRNPLKVMRLLVELDATDAVRMRPGMRFRGTIETRRLEQVLVAPADAVFAGPAGPYVVRRTRLGPRPTAVTVGARTSQSVEIVEGLASGDRIRRGAAAGEGEA